MRQGLSDCRRTPGTGAVTPVARNLTSATVAGATAAQRRRLRIRTSDGGGDRPRPHRVSDQRRQHRPWSGWPRLGHRGPATREITGGSGSAPATAAAELATAASVGHGSTADSTGHGPAGNGDARSHATAAAIPAAPDPDPHRQRQRGPAVVRVATVSGTAARRDAGDHRRLRARTSDGGGGTSHGPVGGHGSTEGNTDHGPAATTTVRLATPATRGEHRQLRTRTGSGGGGTDTAASGVMDQRVEHRQRPQRQGMATLAAPQGGTEHQRLRTRTGGGGTPHGRIRGHRSTGGAPAAAWRQGQRRTLTTPWPKPATTAARPGGSGVGHGNGGGEPAAVASQARLGAAPPGKPAATPGGPELPPATAALGVTDQRAVPAAVRAANGNGGGAGNHRERQAATGAAAAAATTALRTGHRELIHAAGI